MAAGVVPQSSCSLSPMAPASICSSNGCGRLALPLPRKPRVIENASAARRMRAMYHGPGGAGVAVGGGGAGRRPGAAAKHGGDARHERVLDLLRTDEMDMRVDRAGGDNQPLAGDRFAAGADADIDARRHVGIAGLADAGDASVLDADIGLDDSPVVENQCIGDDGVDNLFRNPLALAHAIADHLAP